MECNVKARTRLENLGISFYWDHGAKYGLKSDKIGSMGQQILVLHLGSRDLPIGPPFTKRIALGMKNWDIRRDD